MPVGGAAAPVAAATGGGGGAAAAEEKKGKNKFSFCLQSNLLNISSLNLVNS